MPHPCNSRRLVLTLERATDKVLEISSAGNGCGERNNSACTCATVRLIPHLVPISPQWRMNFCATGVSEVLVWSLISVCTEHTVTTAPCQTLFLPYERACLACVSGRLPRAAPGNAGLWPANAFRTLKQTHFRN